MIRSKFSFLSIYFSSLFFAVLFIFCVHIALTDDFSKGVFSPGVNRIGMYFVTGWPLFCLYMLFRKAFIIKIDHDWLSLHSFSFTGSLTRNEIRSIDLLTRVDLFLSGNCEAIRIELTNGKKIELLDCFYRNMPEMKRAIRDEYGSLVAPIPVRQKRKMTSVEAFDPEYGPSFDRFSGDYFTSANGILFYAVCFALFLVAKATGVFHSSNPLKEGYPYLILVAMFYYLMGIQLYYFNVSDECLEVKNHLFWWYARRFPIDRIIGVVSVRPEKRSRSLRIRTDDLDSRSFGAGSLRQSDWAALLHRLRDLGIPAISDVSAL